MSEPRMVQGHCRGPPDHRTMEDLLQQPTPAQRYRLPAAVAGSSPMAVSGYTSSWTHRLSTYKNRPQVRCVDYKGEFMLADRRYCYPLTITDFASRYLLCCEALGTTKESYAFTVFERAFKDFGLPLAIRTDNGVPFASRSAFFGLSK